VAARFPGGILALDYFGDTDLLGLRAPVPLRVVCLPRDLGLRRDAASLLRSALRLDWDAVACGGGVENHPALLRRLERRGEMLGNGAGSVAAVRSPGQFFTFLRRTGIAHPRTELEARRAPETGAWLWKGARSGGGGRVRAALPREPRPRGFYLQERLAGRPGSIAFVADGRRAVVLGATRQLAGWTALGGSGYRYGGSIAGPPASFLPPPALAGLAAAAAALARRFGLRGLNGLDYILDRGGAPRVLEVNPRPTASMELLEELSGRNFFDLHLRSLRGVLSRPAAATRAAPRQPEKGPFLAKGILYATASRSAPDPRVLERLGCRDRPASGELLEAGQPICTLMARAASPALCRARLASLARRVRRALGPSPLEPAHGTGLRWPPRRPAAAAVLR
jgi:predicted ATP-grasp superfamily ATP-dependent carboligase